jgi:outer membrane protein assembly factor BamE (lipoprotein component of BamABCDE complex)
MHFIPILFFILYSFHCAAQGNVSALKPGMSDIEVRKIMGEPDRIERFATVKYNSFDTSVYWFYQPKAVVVITNHIFDRIEKNRTELLKFIQQNASKKEEGGLTIVSYGKN